MRVDNVCFNHCFSHFTLYITVEITDLDITRFPFGLKKTTRLILGFSGNEYFDHLGQTKMKAIMEMIIAIIQSCLKPDTQFGIAAAGHSRREGEGDVSIAFGTDVTETLLNFKTVLNGRTQLAGETVFEGKKMVGGETILDVVTLG